MRLFSKYKIPIIEDGFNEELHVIQVHILAPLLTFAGAESNNNDLY